MMHLGNIFNNPFYSESADIRISRDNIILGMQKMAKILVNENGYINILALEYLNNVIINQKMTEQQFGAACMYAALKMGSLYMVDHALDMTSINQINEEAISAATRVR